MEKFQTAAFPPVVDVLLVGHFARDLVFVDGKGGSASGGGVYFGSMVLRRMGLEVAVSTRLAAQDFPFLEEMTSAGIHVSAAAARQTSGIANYYKADDMERRTCKPIGFAGPIPLEDIPNIAARVIMITGIIAGELELPTVAALSTRAPLALDVQGFVRVPEKDDLVFKPWPQIAEGLGYVTYLKVDRAEAEHLTGETNLEAAARRLAEYGPREIMITRSSGPLVYAGGKFYSAPFTPHSLAGRTGRGDTCFSAYIGRRLTASPQEAVRWAAAVTTLKQEKPGPWSGDMSEAEELMNEQAGVL
jgi:sugar/nucleoside kinase (ribokinase family)